MHPHYEWHPQQGTCLPSLTGHLSSFVASWWQYNSSRVGVFTPAKCPASCIRYLGVKYTLWISLSKKGRHKTKTVLLSTNGLDSSIPVCDIMWRSSARCFERQATYPQGGEP